MLETLDLSSTLPKAEARGRIDELQNELRVLQQQIRSARIPVVILFEGPDGAGKGDSIATLVEPLDPRGFKVRSTGEPTDEDQARPFLWRFWKDLPSRGDFVIFDRSWYRPLLEDRLDGEIEESQVEAYSTEIREHERQLHADGFVLVKFWLHISKDEQNRRLKKMKDDPWERWRVTQEDRRERFGMKKYLRAAEEMLEKTSSGEAPWQLVAAEDPWSRRVRVLELLVQELQRACGGAASGDASQVNPGEQADYARLRAAALQITITEPAVLLDRVDLARSLSDEEYRGRLDIAQEALRDRLLECYRRRIPTVVVYEGWDAAGKGGNIKRVTQELDPRGYEVVPVAAPDALERSKHYLWRFWRALPRHGHMSIYDRSWYGRVLVERVEGYAAEAEWRRAYEEINRFERHLAEFGTVLVKFWLHLSPEEQLRRFEERENVDHKKYKIGPDDWRNRGRWNAYRIAASEMIERTTTSYAPWTIVEANDKLWARMRTLDQMNEVLREKLGS